MPRTPRLEHLPLIVVIASLGLVFACGTRAPARKAQPGEPPPLSVADTLAVARSYAQAERFDEAVAQYEKARTMGATGRTESAELASVYDVKGDYANAERIYRDWLARVQNDAEFQQQLGLTLLLQKRTDEGVAALKHATELAPDDLHIQQDYGYALLQAGDAKNAERTLKAVVGHDAARSEAWLLLAQAQWQLSDYEAAIAACTSALRADGTNADALRLRARLRMETDNYERAFADYELLARGKPNDAGAYLGAAGALIALNRLGEAKTHVERAEKLAGDHPWVRLRKAQLAWRAGDRMGYEDLRRIATDHPDSIEVWRDIKDAARKFGDKSTAKEAASQLARLQRGEPNPAP